jgi:hypothetical protein
MNEQNHWVDGSQLRNVHLSYDDDKNHSETKSMVSNSLKSSLKSAKHKAAQFERYILFLTWFLMVFSIVTIFYSFLLIRWYFMPNLYFWDATFVLAPYTLLGVGLFTFLISLYGILIQGSDKRKWFAIFAILVTIAFIGQLGSTYFLWQVKTLVSLGAVGGSQVIQSLSLYQRDPSVTQSWDRMQTSLMCCGGDSWHTGYQNYQSTPIGQNRDSVPDSCCINQIEGCGKGMFNLSPQAIRQKIFVHGCVEVLRRLLENEVLAVIPIFAAVSLLVALLEIIVIALASAFVAQITRRRLGDEIL